MNNYVWVVTYEDKGAMTGEKQIDDIFSNEVAAKEHVQRLQKLFPNLIFYWTRWIVNN